MTVFIQWTRRVIVYIYIYYFVSWKLSRWWTLLITFKLYDQECPFMEIWSKFYFIRVYSRLFHSWDGNNQSYVFSSFLLQFNILSIHFSFLIKIYISFKYSVQIEMNNRINLQIEKSKKRKFLYYMNDTKSSPNKMLLH